MKREEIARIAREEAERELSNETEDKEPWEMTREEFKQAVTGGKLYSFTGKPAPYHIGSGATDISRGESEGYPANDIAAYYVARRVAMRNALFIDKGGVYKILSKDVITEEGIDYGREEYIKDALLEGKPVPLEILGEYMNR